MQGDSSGRSGDGKGPPRSLGRYDELNRTHERADTERTARRALHLEHGDPTQPDSSTGAAMPATVTGNDWSARHIAMVDKQHGRLYGQYAPSPGGDQFISGMRTAYDRPLPSPEGGGTAADERPDPARNGQMRITIATLEEKPYAWLALPDQGGAAPAPTAHPARTSVDLVYDRQSRKNLPIASAEVTRRQTKAPAEQAETSLPADHPTERKAGSRRSVGIETVGSGKDAGLDPET